MYVLDSSALIELVENGPGAAVVLEFLNDVDATTTTPSMHEILAGAHSERDQFILHNLFRTMTIFEHDAPAAVAGARIERELTEAGTKINRIDTMIAGICASRGAEIVAFDKDFSKIRGLKTHILKL